MTCTKAQVVLLLEKIEEELESERDRAILRKYIEKVKRTAWAELMAELF